MGRHRDLCAHVVDGINDHIETAEQFAHVLGRKKIIDLCHPAQRIDPANPLAHGRHLGLAKSGIERMGLTVDVRLGNMIEIDQRQMPNAAARERLDHPGPHAANANNTDRRRTQTRKRLVAIEASDTAEAALDIDVGQ